MKIEIIGQGRIARAILYYTSRLKMPVRISINKNESSLRSTDLIIGTLPGGLGKRSLELSLKHKIDIIDLADLDTSYYLNKSDEIKKSKILVIPGSGFCPGLVNFILGNELSKYPVIDTIEVKAGSLSYMANYFPFLWCFEDMVLEFLNPSIQLVNYKKRKFPAFAGYKNENLFKIPAESYLCQSGFENILQNYKGKVANFFYRNIRPLGFMHFFLYMNSYGFFNIKNIEKTKASLEKKSEDNISCSTINLTLKESTIEWLIKSESKKNEALNSMQKITALFTIAILNLILNKKIKMHQLIFCEELGKENEIFLDVIDFLQKNSIYIKNTKKSI